MSEMWDAVADGWERHAGLIEAHLAATTEVLLDRLEVGPGDAVLELACGPAGAGLAAVERIGATGSIVFSDVAPRMVEVAARRAGDRPNVATRVCDLADVGGPDAAFDVVLCRLGLMFGDERAIPEAVRVLRPGGRYGAICWAAREDNPWLGVAFDAVTAELGVTVPPPGSGPFVLGDPEVLAAHLRDGGLADVGVTRVQAPLRCPSLEAWWALVPQTAGPLALALATMDAGMRDGIGARALADAGQRARRTADGVELDGALLVATGRRPG